MPRDKTLSHERVIKAAMEEFLDKGFENASMRAIGEKAGMTPAGLYRHFASKEDMFNALVEPAIKAMNDWYDAHMVLHYNLVDSGEMGDMLFKNSAINLIRDVIYEYKDEFRLIFNCAQGTKYENFVHDTVESEEEDMSKAIDYMRSKGCKIKPLTREELHLFLSAYITALIEPIKHNWSKEEVEHGLLAIEEFFMPGWKSILGY